MNITGTLLMFLCSFSLLQGQTQFPFRNPDLPLEQRVKDLLSRMTLEEKTGQMLYNAPAIERLGIPAYNWWNEGLHGVARAGKATVFPQAIGLAAMWDSDMMLRLATVISDEARAKYKEAINDGRHGIYEGLTFWSPNINIFRDPRWGRGMETYGEDPYLTGCLAVSFVRGMQGNDPFYFKTISTPKHFAVHSGPEPLRHTFDAKVSERDLRETYLPAFRATIMEANAQSVMCAYNRYQGEPCCGNNELIQKILRDEWGFSGYVVSDCWAIMDFYATHKTSPNAPAAAAQALLAGTDLNCGVTYDSLAVAVRKGLVKEEDVDRALARLLRARFRLGMFDPPERVPYASIPVSSNDSKEHRQLAVDATRESIVLLKNENNTLPLRKDLKTIAVIGPNANDVDVLLGNYNGTPADPVTPLQGIRNKVSSSTTVLTAKGCDVALHTPTLVPVPEAVLQTVWEGRTFPGLQGEYFNNHDFAGKPFRVTVDQAVDFDWWENPPQEGMKADSFSVRWTGMIVPPVSGTYSLGVRVFGTGRLFVDDTLFVEFSDRHVVLAKWNQIKMEEGQPHRIKVEFSDRRADALMQLVWEPPDPDVKEKAIKAAKAADAVVMVMGLSPRLEGEEMPVTIPGFSGGDRTDVNLPAGQEELLKQIVSLGKPVVLVLLNGSALGVNYAAEHIPAIVEAWYPGQAAGTALADVLFGDYNPAGRLPVTFYKSIDQLPPFTAYDMEGRTYRYFKGEPLFPFGFGLSYTRFEYRNLKVPATVEMGKPVPVSVDVINTGAMDGDEVVELYVTDVRASAPVPVRSLEGFRRIHLKRGEKSTVSFALEPRQLSLINNQSERVVEPGQFRISVGGKQPGFHGVADANTTQTLGGSFDIVGDILHLKP